MTAYKDLRGRIDNGEVIILDGAVGTQLQIDVMVEFWRQTVTATVVKKPFFDPKRKRA